MISSWSTWIDVDFISFTEILQAILLGNMVTLVDGIFTVTLQDAVFPLPVFPIIVAEPLPPPVTTSDMETFTILLLELLHYRLSFVSDDDSKSS